MSCFIVFNASFCFAQDWSLTTADLQTHPAVFRSITTDSVRVQMPGLAEPSTIPLDHFVSLQRIQSSPPTHVVFTLFLSGGNRLTGEPVKVVNEQLIWHNPSLGEIPIPLARLIAMTRNRDVTNTAEPPKQDIVTLANGDTVAGVLVDCTAEKIQVRTDTGSSEIPVATVTQISFAATASSPPIALHGFRIKLADGSSITTTTVSATDNQVTISIDEKPPRKVQLPLSQITSIEQLDGPISWLSSRVPIENVQIPYFTGSPIWPAKMDKAVDGSPLRFNDQAFAHGIGVHAYSRLTYAIDPAWKSFRTQYAIQTTDDFQRPLADVTVRIILDGKTVHEQSHLHAGLLSPPIKIDLTAAKTLTLEADYGNTADTQAHLNWLEPALQRDSNTPNQ